MTRAVRIAALAAACGGGVAIAWWLVRDPADARARVVAPPCAVAGVDAAAESAAVEAPIVAVVVEEPRVDAATSDETDATTAPRDAEQAAGAAIAALAASLRDPQWRRVAWDVEVAATCRSAGAAALAEIERRLSGRGELDDDAFVAAGELLRVGGRPLAGAAERLRRIAFAVVEEDHVSQVAARALAACGDDVDRGRLLDRACEAEPAGRRSSAQWALAAAPADRLLALALRRLEPGATDATPDATEALLVAIDGALRRTVATELQREVVGSAAAAIGDRLTDPEADARLQARARSAGKALARACEESNDPRVRDVASRLAEPRR